MANDLLSVGQTGPATDAAVFEVLRDREMLVVSNRQPYRHTTNEEEISVERPTGGLTASLDPIMREMGGTWIAWGDGDRDAEAVDARDCVAVPPNEPSYELRRVWLSEKEVTDYYYGYCNRVLWPVCHSALTRVRAGLKGWDHYRDVNEKFAEAIIDRVGGRPLVWFHDYHLGLAPRSVRSALGDDTLLMQFWHIPWPAWDVYRSVPHRRELLLGLLSNDLLVFHVPRYRRHFLACVSEAVPSASVDWGTHEVTVEGHVTTVAAVPMGVDVEDIREDTTSLRADAFWARFRLRHDLADETRIGLGVDRLDYTKGLVERLRALERFWETNHDHRETFTYVQIASESRSRIPDYEAVQNEVAAEVDRINQRFGTDSWKPIVYLTDRLANHELSALYSHADVCIVSPLRDGLNLVAQEYVAAQTDGDGVLVLSDQAGVHDEIGDDAVSIRPTDIEGFAEAIARAIAMPPGERVRRIGRLTRWVEDHDLHAWLQANFVLARDVEGQ